MSTELFCETYVAGGATATRISRFAQISYYFVPVVRGTALLLKLWMCMGLRGF